jgi:WD40 repeat protein
VAIGFEGEVILRNLADKSSHRLNLDILEFSGATFSPDGRLFAVASGLGHARVWDAVTWREAATLRGYLLGVASVAFSPDGKRLATGSDKQEALRLWDTESWQDVLTLEGQGDLFFSTSFSPDGNTIGSLDYFGILHLWRAPSWAEIKAAEANKQVQINLH